MKFLIWLLIIGTGFLIAIGITERETNFYIFAAIAFVVALFLGLGPTGVLRREEVSGRSGALIGEADGRGEAVLSQTEQLLEESEAPAVSWERKNVSPSIFRWGDRREFLVITGRERRRLRHYKIYVHARDYGRSLSVSMFVTFKPGLFRSLLNLIPHVRLAFRDIRHLNLFEDMDLGDFLGNAEDCFQKAVEGLAQELGQDVSKINFKRKGVLEIW